MDEDERKGVLTHDMLRGLLQEGKIAFPTITEEEIKDRSKADGLAKGIAVLQTTWFIAQCISRPAQGLIITEIELITLAIAALNGLLYFLWWNKPLDVRCCVPVLLLHGEDRKPVEIPHFEAKSELLYLIDLKEMNRRNAPESSQIFSSIFSWVHIRWLLNSPGHLKGYMASESRPLQCLIPHIKERILTVDPAIACALLVELVKFPFRMFHVLVLRGADIFDAHDIDKDAIRVPTFYAHPKLDRTEQTLITLTSIVAMLFGGIHCAGWNLPFPSHAELIIWRVSSLIILIVPCTSMLTMRFMGMDVPDIIVWILGSAFFFGLVIYALARLTLFVEAFITLRHLPLGAYSVVEWTALLLHM